MSRKPTTRSQKPDKPYWEMTTSELAAATREFDDPNYQPPALPLTAADKAQQQRARRRGRPGRPRIGAGTRRVQLTVEQTLLSEADGAAKARGLTRAQFFARALQAALAKAG